ncbi:MAG TPA: hypothetical protein VF516_25790 [Kofleriaceae bacterium]
MREHGDRIDRRASSAIEERVRPGLSAQLPAEDLADRAGQEPDVGPGGAGRRGAHGELSEDAADRRAEVAVGGAERLGDHADERDPGPYGVAQRGLAAHRVPAVEALGGQAQPGDAIGAAHEAERRRRDLDDVTAAVRVEQVGAPEVVGIGLAVVAVADDAVHGVARGVLEAALDFTAAAMQIDGRSHGSSCVVDLGRPSKRRRRAACVQAPTAIRSVSLSETPARMPCAYWAVVYPDPAIDS